MRSFTFATLALVAFFALASNAQLHRLMEDETDGGEIGVHERVEREIEYPIRVARAPLLKSALAGAAVGVGASHFISKAKKKKGRAARSPLLKSAAAGAAVGVGASHFIKKG